MDWDEIKKLDFKLIDSIVQESRAELLFTALTKSRDLAEWSRYLDANPPSPLSLAIALTLGLEKFQSTNGREAAFVRHSKPNGSREKQKAIRMLWASGKYKSRDICAEQECAALNMSFSTARKALRNTPDPT